MKNINSLAFLIFLGALAALPPLATDMALPALNSIAANLHCSLSAAGLTLTVFMAGFAATPLVYGPASDQIGRRPVIMFGIALFAAGSFAAAAAPGIVWLLLARFLEGAGAGAGMSMAFAVQRDLFEGEVAVQKLSYVQSVVSLAPLVAPSIGAVVLGFADWRVIYGLLGAAGIALLATVLLGFDESHYNRRRSGSPLAQVRAGYGVLLRSRAGMGFALVFACNFGVQFAFISGSPLVFMGHFGVSAWVYGVIFAICSAGTMAGAFFNVLLSRRGIGFTLRLSAAMGLYVASSLVIVVLTLVQAVNLIDLTMLLFASSFAFGVVGPNASHGTLAALPEIAGIAGSILASLQMTAAVLASAAVAAAYASFGVLAMGGVMLGFALLGVGLYVAVARPPALLAGAAE
jgi:DHA1 family bicyclomycin/chloramphenicol resistance-like MFS transporter